MAYAVYRSQLRYMPKEEHVDGGTVRLAAGQMGLAARQASILLIKAWELLQSLQA